MAEGHAGGAYARLDKTENYVGQALTNLGNVAFRDRQVKQQRADKIKEEKDKQDQSFATDLGKISSDTTKFSNQNEFIIDAMHKLRDGVANKANELKLGKITKLDYDKYNSNAQSQIGLIDQSAKRINLQSADYSKQLSEGKIHPAFAQNAMNFGGAYDNVRIKSNVNNNGVIDLDLYDDKGSIIEKGDLSKIGQNAFAPIPNYDIDKDLQEFYKTYPPVLNEKITGNQKIGIKGISPEIKLAIDAKVNALIKDKNTLAVSNYVRSGKANPNVSDEKDIEETKKYLTSKYTSLYSNQKSVDEAYGGASNALANKKFNYEVSQDAKEIPEFGLSSVAVSKNPQTLGDVKAPPGTPKISYNGLIKGDPKKAYEQMTDVAVVKTKKGFVVTGKVKSFGGENVSTKETKYKQSYYDKVKWLNTHPKATDAQKENYQPDETDVLSETTTQKQVPARYLRFGKNAPEVAEFLKGTNMTVAELQRQAIIDAGYNPDEKFDSNEIVKDKGKGFNAEEFYKNHKSKK